MTPWFPHLAALLLGVLSLIPGCSWDGPCVTPPAEACAPLYPTDFDHVWDETLSKRCALGGSSCHGPGGNSGGLSMSDADQAYSRLMKDLVIPGDPSCSELMKVLEGTEGNDLMPPGSRLSAEERCAVATWIREGAER